MSSVVSVELLLELNSAPRNGRVGAARSVLARFPEAKVLCVYEEKGRTGSVVRAGMSCLMGVCKLRIVWLRIEKSVDNLCSKHRELGGAHWSRLRRAAWLRHHAGSSQQQNS